ncbi:uncharacterized protein MISP3 isoform X2 [Paroedura picta]|uniref:uncharacterized protein MISP3 isoform X2 n=1 Tax=Paroedura picta TaxID=143630 RepID=UPI004057ABAE
MTTEARPLPASAAEEDHGGPLREGQESSEAFRVENGDMAKHLVLTAAPDDSWVPPLDGALISFDEDPAAGHPSASVQKDSPFAESSQSLSLLTSSEAPKTAADDPGQNGSHFVLQGKGPDSSLEQFPSGWLGKVEDSSHSACQGRALDIFSETPSPAENTDRRPEGEEERPHDRQEAPPAAAAVSLQWLEALDASSRLGQGEEERPHGQDGDTSEVRSELQPSDSSLSGLHGVGEESQKLDLHGKTPEGASELPAQLEASGSPQETACSVENSQDGLPPELPTLLLQGPDAASQAWEGSRPPLPGPSGPPSAEPQGMFDAAKANHGLQPGGREMTVPGEGERLTGGLQQQPPALGKELGDQVMEETPGGTSQGREEPVARERDPSAEGPSQALASSSVGTGDQQRAAGTGWEETFPQAVPPEPAPGGLTPGHDGEEREGPGAPESCAARSMNRPLGEAGAQTAPESEEGEEAAEDAGPGSATREPVGARVSHSEAPCSEDSPEAMVLACAQESHQENVQALSHARYVAPHSEQAGPQARPRGDLPCHPTDPEDGENAADPIRAAPLPDDLSGAGGPPAEDGHRCPPAETPIEREIRLHLAREELLRQQRGLASARGTPEYVEVRIRPILSQSVPPSPQAKEKELQWAGAQMQREIQRECQREEALVQLGKVRGAYDRGTPQELQEKKMIFEQQAAPAKTVPGSWEGSRERSFAEADGASRAPQQPSPERPPAAHPFFCLRAKSPQSLLEREVQEAQEREWELQRQRHKIYGAALPRQPEAPPEQEGGEEAPFQPERPPCKKLDVTWPPPSPSEPCQVNGLHQLERSPRSRQRSALIQRWESGAVGSQESQD